MPFIQNITALFIRYQYGYLLCLCGVVSFLCQFVSEPSALGFRRIVWTGVESNEINCSHGDLLTKAGQAGRHHVFFCLSMQYITDVNENKLRFCIGLMPIFTVDVLMPLGNTNQNSKHFPQCVIQILIQDPLCTESAQCPQDLFIECFVFLA